MTVFKPGDRVHLKHHARTRATTGTVVNAERFAGGHVFVRWDDNQAVTSHLPQHLEPAGEPMSTDPRIEAAALEDATDVVWSRSMGEIGVCCQDRERDDYKDAEEIAKEAITAYLAAADKAATITTVEGLDALPVGSVVLDRVDCCYRLYYDSTDDFPVWCIVGEEMPSSPRAWLPARLLHRGTK